MLALLPLARVIGGDRNVSSLEEIHVARVALSTPPKTRDIDPADGPNPDPKTRSSWLPTTELLPVKELMCGLEKKTSGCLAGLISSADWLNVEGAPFAKEDDVDITLT